MAIEAISTVMTSAGIEAAKKMATEAARQLADKIVSGAMEKTSVAQPGQYTDDIGQIQQMENRNIGEVDRSEASERTFLKQREAEAAQDLKEKIEGRMSEVQPVYEGGRYGDLAKKSIPGTEIHHIPPASVNGLAYNDGPAIRMDVADHRQTASFGSSNEARAYRAEQEKLVYNGRFEDALKNDIADLKEKFGDKYEDGASQTMAFYDKLHNEGKC